MRATRLIGLGTFVILLLVACGTGGGGTTPPPSSGLQIAVSGLPDGADANIRVLGPDGYQEMVTQDRTLSSLPEGPYEVIASMVAAASGDVYAASEVSRTVSITATSGARVEVAYETEPVRLTEDAVVLDGETLAAIASFTPAGGSSLRTTQVDGGFQPAAHGTFVFDQDTSVLRTLEVGDVFAIEPQAEAPYGALGRVTDIRRSSGQVTVILDSARVDEAVDSGYAYGRAELVNGVDTANVEYLAGAVPGSLRTQQDGDGDLEACLALSRSLGDAGDAGAIKVGGELCFSADFQFSARFGSETEIELITELTKSLELSASFEQELAAYDSGFLPVAVLAFPPVTVPAGPVPLVFIPRVLIGVQVEGGVAIGASVGATGSITLTNGILVNADHPNGKLIGGITPSFEPQPITPSVGVNAKVSAGAQADFLLYGVTGGTAKAIAYLGFESDAVEADWRLYTGFEVGAGFKFQLLAARAEATVDFPIAETTLLEGSFDGPQVTVAPVSATIGPSETQVFTATVSGTSDATVDWSIDEPDCGSLTGSGASVTYTAPDVPQTVVCTVRATLAAHSLVTDAATVTVSLPSAPPTIDNLTVAPSPGTEGEPVEITWTVTSETTPVTCRVDVDGNGVNEYVIDDCASQSNLQQHTFLVPDDYTIVVTATDDRGQATQDSILVTIEATSPPVTPSDSYITIDNAALGSASGGTRPVGFDIAWDESWRGPDRPTWVAASDNWDAAWVFVKYRVDGDAWQHATLAPTGHVAPAGAVVDVPGDGMGAFVYRSGSGYGTFAADGVGLAWDYGADGVAAGASVEVQPFAIEMVFVPEGAFSVGSGGSSTGEFREGGTASTPFVVSNQASIALGNAAGQLYWTSSTNTGSPSGSTNASFPTGYGGFYVMKHEVTQGQYVDFLNSLTQAQADVRKYTGSSYRYAITGSSVGSYATSLPYVPVNHVSWADGAAFADWAGLRPMTELEFEKAARGPLAPIANEYAWGSTSITQATGLVDAGTIAESPTPTSANAAYSNAAGVQGPVRAGSFATPGDSRRDAGAGFYGTLDLSGNLWERTVTVGNTDGRAFTGAHGDGALGAGGDADVAAWPGASAVGAGFRGGYWLHFDDSLRASNRSNAALTYAIRNFLNGWRGVRSAP